MDNNNMSSAKASRETFWTVLNEKKYVIYIPRIQRDYAQGRKEPEPTQIRQSFLEDIFGAVQTGKQLDINFIYGNIEHEGNIDKFIPIDGQQRLTTLFLLHWYFAMYSKQKTEDVKNILGRFQYETRHVTGHFCRHLIEDVDVELKQILDSEKTLTEVIQDYYWFFSDYENDATIKAMLVMLETIHSKVKALADKSAVDNFFEKLTGQEKPVSFLFLNILDVGLTDEIYIKMNARGKALTRFENFKAQLSAFLSKTDEKFSREFLTNINGEWAQFFWNKDYRGESVVFDDQVMSLFRFLMMNEYISNVNSDNSSDAKYRFRKVLQTLINESDFVFTSRLFFDGFMEVAGYKSEKVNVDINVFRFINRLLNILSLRKKQTGKLMFTDERIYSKKYLDEENYFKRLIRATKEKDLSYEDRILIYAEFCFLVEYANTDNTFDKEHELTSWLRVIYNLTRNTLYNQADDYFRGIRCVREIIENDQAKDILNYLAHLPRKAYKQGSGFGFYEGQVLEECIKSLLIRQSNNWKRAIIEAENSYMESQIAVILAYSGVWEAYIEEMMKWENANTEIEMIPHDIYFLAKETDSSISYNNFVLYLKKMNMIFNEQGIKEELEKQSIFRRALLCFGGADSYLLPPGKAIQSFLDNNDREYSFKRLMRDENKGKREYLKHLLDKIDETKDIISQLNAIVTNMTYDNDNRWKTFFIQMPEILDCMYQNKDKYDPMHNFVFYDSKRFISRHGNDAILLLERTSTRSTNRELYSYVLYLKLKSNNLAVEYKTSYTEGAEKYTKYVNKQNKEVQVLYQSENGNYMYIARTDATIVYRGDLEHMLDYVEQSIK